MMDQDRITQYIHSLDQGHGAFCDRIAKDARRAVYPLSGRKRQVFCRPWWRQNSRSTFWRLEQP